MHLAWAWLQILRGQEFPLLFKVGIDPDGSHGIF